METNLYTIDDHFAELHFFIAIWLAGLKLERNLSPVRVPLAALEELLGNC